MLLCSVEFFCFIERVCRNINLAGDWSMGVLDRYFKFGDAGDQYKGRMLALFNCHDTSFMTLPPHFKQLDSDGADLITTAIHRVFGSNPNSIAVRHKSFHPVLQRLLASMVYHEPFLRQSLPANHAIFSIELYRDRELLTSLSSLVTIKAEESYLTPTGIPPHIQNIARLESIIFQQQRMLEILSNVGDTVKDTIISTIHDVLETRAQDNGHITYASLRQLLTENQETTATLISEGMNTIRDAISSIGGDNMGGGLEEPQNDMTIIDGENGFDSFCYDGQVWSVPRGYKFPSGRDGVNWITGLKLWMLGDKSRRIGMNLFN